MRTQHVSRFTLHLLELDALAAAERAEVEGHARSCERCRRDAGAVLESREHFTRYLLPRGPLRRRADRRRWWWWLWATPVAAAIVLVLLVRLRPPELAVKGAPSFSTYVRRHGQVALLHDGEPLAAGDEARFVVVSERLPYLLVCSIDGEGKPSVYFPFGGVESGAIELRTRVELPGSVVLDDARGPERLFALFSARPISALAATAALRELAGGGPEAIRSARGLPLAADAQVTVSFEKLP